MLDAGVVGWPGVLDTELSPVAPEAVEGGETEELPEELLGPIEPDVAVGSEGEFNVSTEVEDPRL